MTIFVSLLPELLTTEYEPSLPVFIPALWVKQACQSMYESIVCSAFHLVHFKISRFMSFISNAVFFSPEQPRLCECIVLLPFQSFLLWLLSERRRLPPREHRWFHLCVSVWTNGTWLLCFWPLYFVGARCVYLMRETETADVFWGQGWVCSEE